VKTPSGKGITLQRKHFPAASRRHPGLQDQHRRYPVNGLGALFDADFGLAQDSIRFRRGQPLIPEVHGNLEALLQLLGKQGHLLGLDANFPAETERVTDYQLDYLVLADHAFELPKVRPLVFSLDRIQSLRRDAQRIADGNPDSSRTNVERKNAATKRRIVPGIQR
jgi:hypothetical protein